MYADRAFYISYNLCYSKNIGMGNTSGGFYEAQGQGRNEKRRNYKYYCRSRLLSFGTYR